MLQSANSSYNPYGFLLQYYQWISKVLKVDPHRWSPQLKYNSLQVCIFMQSIALRNVKREDIIFNVK